MQRNRDVLLFVVSFVLISLLLWLVLTRVQSAAAPFSLHSLVFAVPAVSAMLSARGFGLRHRLAYAFATFGLCLLIDLVSGVSGLSGLAWRQNEARVPYGLGPLIYFALTWAVPFAMLILFVGRRPSLLWTRGTR